MSRWRKAGVVRISRSKKVLLIAVDGLEPFKWLIVDVGDVFELIEGNRESVDIFEGNNGKS